MKFYLLSLAFLISFEIYAQNEDSLFIRRIADEVLVNGKAYENLHSLTKNIGQRLTASPGWYKAEVWAVKTLKDAGADNVYMQECTVPHWIRGGKDEAMIMIKGSKPQPIDVLALGNSLGTGKEGITASIILINSFDELENKKDELKGKIVFYDYKFNPKFIKTFQAYGDAVRYRGQGASRAAKYGAVGVLIRSMTHSTDNNPHTGAMNYNDSFPKIPAFAVGLIDADKLARILKNNTNVQLFMRSNARFLPDTIGHNIIGEIRGTEFPDEIITFGGHLDSWDPGEGAHDDGAGVVHNIEAMRVLKALGYKPKHTLRVVLFANEENGTRGANKYAQLAKEKNEKHLFALESDEGGFTPRDFSFTLSKEKLNKIQFWVQLLSPYGISSFTEGGGGSDIGPLNKAFGTPMAGYSPDSQRYFDIHHARSDVFENVNKRELELGAINIAALIYLVDKYGLD